ncbi:unnamed protein product [Somion occarium]
MLIQLPPIRDHFGDLLHPISISDIHSGSRQHCYAPVKLTFERGLKRLHDLSDPCEPQTLPPLKRTRKSDFRHVDQPSSYRRIELPADIYHLIIENYWDQENICCTSRKTVCALALTCREWRAVARRHIFRSIVLRNEEELNKLVSIIRREKDISGYIWKVRLYGSLPASNDSGQDFPLKLATQDSWIYQFPSVFGSSLPSIRILELFNFAHLSPLQGDCQIFAGWVCGLATLQSVEVLNLKYCEMGPNCLTALVRAFSRLKSVGLREVDFTTPEEVTLLDVSTPTSNRPIFVCRTIASRFGLPAVIDILDRRESLVKYKLFNPCPPLQSLYIDNAYAMYKPSNLGDFVYWFDPKAVSRSLISLSIGTGVDMKSVARFLTSLGSCPSLRNVNMYVSCNADSLMRYGVDMSNLVNLKTLRLRCGMLDIAQTHATHYLLSSLPSRCLKRLIIVIQFDSYYKEVELLDEYLNSEKFETVEEFCVEFLEDDQQVSKEVIRKEIFEMFPRMMERGLLAVDEYRWPYLCY